MFHMVHPPWAHHSRYSIVSVGLTTCGFNVGLSFTKYKTKRQTCRIYEEPWAVAAQAWPWEVNTMLVQVS